MTYQPVHGQDRGMTVRSYDDGESWDETVTIAPEQVAYRLHDLLRQVNLLGGVDAPEWEELTPDEQEVGLAIAEVAVAWMLAHEPDSPVHTAKHVHNIRVWLSSGTLRAWDELTDDERQVSIAVIQLIIYWLDREGPR